MRLTNNVDKAEVVDRLFENFLDMVPDRPFSLDLGFLGIPLSDLKQIDDAFTEEEV
jgi:hypothetical protein